MTEIEKDSQTSEREFPHLFLRNPSELADSYSERSRRPQNSSVQPEEHEEQEVYPIFQDFHALQANSYAFQSEKQQRLHRRTIPHLEHVDYLEIGFFKPVESQLLLSFRREYSLSAVKFKNFDRNVLFSVLDEEKLQLFIQHINELENLKNRTLPRDQLCLFEIQDFHYLSSEKRFAIPKPEDGLSQVNLQLTDSIESFEQERKINAEIIIFLKQHQILFDYSESAHLIELQNPDRALIDTLLDNFDTIYTVQSFRGGVIRPSTYGVPVRDFGFTLQISADVPLIGVIDSGISALTPLAAILHPDRGFDITNTHSDIDNINHGTGVALLAAVGESFYNHNPRQLGQSLQFEADAQILSIKVLDENGQGVSYHKLEALIRKAHQELGIRLFVLTIANQDPVQDNSIFSPQAQILDKLASELDILICISIGNRRLLINATGIVDYPSHFQEEISNLHVPAEAMNHLTVGAIADNFEPMTGIEFTPDKSFPAVYTSKSHLYLSQEAMNRSTRLNKHLFKPDLVHFGGDADHQTKTNTTPALEVLSAVPGEYFCRNIGTSYSAPLIANLAARLLRRYPDLRMQSIKALLINSASNPWGTQSIPEQLPIPAPKINYLIGHGLPNALRCLQSSSNRVVLVLEDEIQINKNLKCLAINLPPGLAELDRQRILKVTATLCFAFQPVVTHHMAYCPVYLTFGFFKNVPLEDLATPTQDNPKFNSQSGWASDYYWKRAPLSNTQKKQFTISKNQLVDQENQIKLALKSKWHGLLSDVEKQQLKPTQTFSLVIEIESLQQELNLYDDLQALNQLESILPIDAELSIDDLQI